MVSEQDKFRYEVIQEMLKRMNWQDPVTAASDIYDQVILPALIQAEDRGYMRRALQEINGEPSRNSYLPPLDK
jgi:hypothetical protein